MEPVTQQIYTDVKVVLETLASQLGTGIETFWPEFVKVQSFAPIVSLAIMVASAAMFILTLIASKKYIIGDGLADILLFVSFIGILVGVVGFLASGSCLLSPEYCALKEVLRMVNPL